MALSSNNLLPRQEKLYYFTGKVRAFWKDSIFFLDQHNAAIVSIENLYLNGKAASLEDLQLMEKKVASSEWESAPVFHSYIARYSSTEAPPWPYKLKGKKLWMAKFAWTGILPSTIEEHIQNLNVEYTPLAYYTGKLMKIFDDKVLYGDARNRVMVHISHFFVYGQKADYRNVLGNIDENHPIIHSFVTKLSFLTNKNYDGPEPHLPTWPMNDFGSATWVAKFAWHGEMPEEIKHQLNRYKLIKLYEWDDDCIFTGNIPCPLKPKQTFPDISSSLGAVCRKGININTEHKPLIPFTQTDAAIVKGGLLVANHTFGLINSYLDVIVFSTKNFYVNGEIFREGMFLNDFFRTRKVPLTAWMVPLEKPICVFDIYVRWRAVCAWYGVPPRNMEAIKNRFDNGIIAGMVPGALSSANPNKYTLVIGSVTNIYHNGGLAKAKVGNEMINITFKSNAVYVYGYNVHIESNLEEIRQELETGKWTMLIYPVMNDKVENTLEYSAFALWQYQYQHFVSGNLYHRLLAEGNSSVSENCIQKFNTARLSLSNTGDRQMVGWIVKTSPQYGIIEATRGEPEPTFVYFRRSIFYVDGETPLENEFLDFDRYRQCYIFAHPVAYQEIDSFPVALEATLVWMGKRPQVGYYPSTQEPLMPLSARGMTNGPDCNTLRNQMDSGNLSPTLLTDDKFRKTLHVNVPKRPTDHKAGFFVFLRDRFGVVKCGNRNADDDYILFDFSVLWIDGILIGENEGLYNEVIYDEIQCNLLAYAIPNVDVGGFPVNMQATAVWIGKMPQGVKLPLGKSLKSLADTEKNSEHDDNSGYISKPDSTKRIAGIGGMTDKLSQVSLKDSSISEFVKLKNNPPKFIIDHKNPYVGRHITARVITLLKDTGLAKWRCTSLEGFVYVEFKTKDIYINLCPLNDQFEKGMGRVANFFVIPIKHKIIEGCTVSLAATCGWIGSKPQFIPVPGQQDHSQICFENLHVANYNVGRQVIAKVVKLHKHMGIARWRSLPLGGDIFIEFDVWDCCPNMRSYFNETKDFECGSRVCHFYVLPIAHKEVCGYTVSLSATCGWMGIKPPHFPKPKADEQPDLDILKLHITPVDPSIIETRSKSEDGVLQHKRLPQNGSKLKEKGIKGLDNVAVNVSSNKVKIESKRKHKNCVWEDEDAEKSEMEGTIIELHSNVGRLQGRDGTQHYFARENSYLYGVNLSSVELWHVLVQDEKVHYKLNEISPGVNKVSKMWIGPEKLEDFDQAAAYIYEWCSKHLVPDGAKEVLVHQLQASQKHH